MLTSAMMSGTFRVTPPIVTSSGAPNGMTANVTRAGMLGVVGFDTAAPRLIADFAAGRL